jgi:hypothetical protein
MPMLDTSGGPSDATFSGNHRIRHDWVRGDVRCLMCGRLLGRLLGTTRLYANGDRSAGQPVAFLAYRPLDPVECIVPFTPGLRFRCRACGGAGALDDLELFSTYDDTSPDETEAEIPPMPRRRGRPKRRFRAHSVSAIAAAIGGF